MGLKGQRLIPYVTSLPASPSDGQEVFYAADATNNVIWNLRYRSGSASTYKWEFIGGDPLESFQSESSTRSSTAYGDFASVGPSITAPLVGEYMAEWTAAGGNNTSGQFDIFIGIQNGAVNPADADAIRFTPASSTTGRDLPQGLGFMRRLITVANAADVLKMVARGTVANLITVERRVLSVQPVRVTG
jgi:hypothetical protein